MHTAERTVWIARHGNRQDFVDPDWKKTARWPHDPALSPDGVVQAQELAERLRGEPIDHIFASPFLRTVETASHTAEALGLPVKIEAGMSEWMNAEWFGDKLTLIPLAEKYKRFACADRNYTSCVTPAYPETWEDLKKRVARMLTLIFERFSGNILLVGHGASVDVSARTLVGEDAEISSPLCCLIQITGKNGRWNLDINGDVSHLSGSQTAVRWI